MYYDALRRRVARAALVCSDILPTAVCIDHGKKVRLDLGEIARRIMDCDTQGLHILQWRSEPSTVAVIAGMMVNGERLEALEAEENGRKRQEVSE